MEQSTETGSTIGMRELIGSNIRSLREGRKWTQEQLAKRLGPYGGINTRFQVKDVELGKRALVAEELFALSLVFDQPTWRFFAPSDSTLDQVVNLGEQTIDVVKDLCQRVETKDEDAHDYAVRLIARRIANGQVTPSVNRVYQAIGLSGLPLRAQ